MIRVGFSYSLLRMGYDVNEVPTFLVDIGRTLIGEEMDPERVVTAQKALDLKFSTKLRGLNDEEVGAEIDCLTDMLRCAEHRRVVCRANSAGSDVHIATLSATEPTTASSEYADFGMPETVKQIPHSMTQEKEQSRLSFLGLVSSRRATTAHRSMHSSKTLAAPMKMVFPRGSSAQGGYVWPLLN